MNNPQISVIVPVYNTEKWLRRCVDSILAQTFTDFELLLIDDGSTDGSPAICDEYAQRDSRIKVFYQKNSGVSAARNSGLDHARGEWILFVDADDYLYEDALDNLLRKPQADLIVGGYFHIGTISGREKSVTPIDRKIDINGDTDFFSKMIGSYLTTPWCKLFRNDIIHNNNLKFNKYLFYGEDTDFVFRYVLQIDTIQFISKQVYCYIDPENTVGKYVLNAQHLKKLMECTYRNFELLAKKTGASFDEMRHIFLRDYSSLYLRGVMNIHSYRDFLNEAKAYKMGKCLCFADSFKYKIFVLMLRSCPRVAYACIRFTEGLIKIKDSKIVL